MVPHNNTDTNNFLSYDKIGAYLASHVLLYESSFDGQMFPCYKCTTDCIISGRMAMAAGASSNKIDISVSKESGTGYGVDIFTILRSSLKGECAIFKYIDGINKRKS